MSLCSVDKDVLLNLWPPRCVLMGASTCHLLRSTLCKAAVVRMRLKSKHKETELNDDALAKMLGMFEGEVLMACSIQGSHAVLNAVRNAMQGGWSGPCGLNITREDIMALPAQFCSELRSTFASCQALKCINLYNLQLCSDGTEQLASALQHLDGAHLLELELGGNGIQSDGLLPQIRSDLRC